jgi:outer membrane protein OmpA-like peptidoglycan-associated protein
MLMPKAPVAVEAEPQITHFDLSADALFSFGRSGWADVLPEGRAQLEGIARQLRTSNVSSVQVIGHTDVIGDAASNQVLSQRRADTVRDYLVDHGVRADAVSAIGVGKTKPVQTCDMAMDHDKLVACLQPNRRVEIVASLLR